jgi:hypothetical protein
MMDLGQVGLAIASPHGPEVLGPPTPTRNRSSRLGVGAPSCRALQRF